MKLFKKGELRVLWPFYLEFLAYTLHFAPAFIVLYFIGLGLTMAQIGILLAVMPLASLIFEIPTGAIADIYGRKFSVLLGYLLEGAIIFSIFFAKNYSLLLMLFILEGAAATLSSGSKEAWIFDLIKKKNKRYMHSYFAKEQFFKSIALIMSGIIGALLVKSLGLSIIWIFFGASFLVSIIILLFAEEIYKKRNVAAGQSFNEIFIQSKKSIKYSISHPVLFYLLIAGFFMIISVVFAESLAYIPFLTQLNFPAYAFGYFWSGMSLVAAIAPLCTKNLMGKKKELNFLIFATLIGSLILLLIYFVNSYPIALFVILTSLFFFTLKYPVERPYFHKFVPSKLRATISSFESMVFALAGIIAFPIGGYLIDLIGAKNVIILSALLGIPTIIAYLMVKEKPWLNTRNK